MDDKIKNPFPGLRAFEENEDILFFGREKQIDDLLRKLRMSRFLAIIGSSGSGKSSLVKSGMLPALQSGFMSGAGSQWRIALFRPGNDPIRRLTEALSKNGILRDEQSPDDLKMNTAINESILRRSNLGLIETYRQSGLNKKNNLLVLVDQFEELFRFSKYEKEELEGKRDSIAFINLLLKAAEQKEYPIYVVLTMRSDFLGDCTEFRGLPEAINEGQYLIPRMTREERREAITGPIAVGGATITPSLLNRLLNDVGDDPDQLPLLQHALMRTWDAWQSKNRPDDPIDIPDYEQIGTITKALSQHADEAYMELAKGREQMICERIFKELTDKKGSSSGIRRPRLLLELAESSGASNEEVMRVIERFRKSGRGFLMPADTVELLPKSIIDISHESIMRIWVKLKAWLEDEEESAQVYEQLCKAANDNEKGKFGENLYTDPELQVALNWKTRNNPNAAWASRYNLYFDKAMHFLDASELKRKRDKEFEEKKRKEQIRRNRNITIIISVIALIAFLEMINAFQKESEARNAKIEAEKQKTKALDEKKIADQNEKNAEAAKAIALVEKEKAKESEDTAIAQKKIAETQEKIAKSEKSKAVRAQKRADSSANDAINSANAALASEQRAEENRKDADRNRVKAENEKEKAEHLQRLSQSKNEANKGSLFLNEKEYIQGRDLALSAYDNNISNQGDFQDNDIYTALLLSWENSRYTEQTKIFNSPVRSVTGLPGTNYVISGDEGGKINILKFNEINDSVVAIPPEVKTGKGLRSISVSPSGNYLLAVLSKKAILYKIDRENISLRRISSINLPNPGKHGIFLDDNNFLVQHEKGVARYDVNNPTHIADSLSVDSCFTVAKSRTGEIFISSGARILEYGSWKNSFKDLKNTYALTSVVTSLETDPTGKFLAAGAFDGRIWIINPSTNEKQAYPAHRSAVNDLKFAMVAPGKLQLASASSDKTIKLNIFDDDNKLNTEDEIVMTEEHSKWVYALYYTPDNKFLFSGSEDQYLKWRPSTMKELYNILKK